MKGFQIDVGSIALGHHTSARLFKDRVFQEKIRYQEFDLVRTSFS